MNFHRSHAHAYSVEFVSGAHAQSKYALFFHHSRIIEPDCDNSVVVFTASVQIDSVKLIMTTYTRDR